MLPLRTSDARRRDEAWRAAGGSLTRARQPEPRRTRRWYVAACLTVAVVLVALAPPLPHEPWVLGGFAAGYLTAVLDRALARGAGRHR